MNFNDNEISRMSRRRFVRTASALGVSAACLQYGTRQGLAEAAGENEVPYVRRLRYLGRDENGERQHEPVYGSIHRDKWEPRHTANDAAQKIGQMVEDRGWDTGFIAPGWGCGPERRQCFRRAHQLPDPRRRRR